MTTTTNPTPAAKHLLADLVAGTVTRPALSRALIELSWLGLVDGDRRPTALALEQPWL